jgi:hypothetical protein
MANRRPLIEALKDKTPAERAAEEKFVFGDASSAVTATVPTATPTAVKSAKISRVPLTTRIRSDLAQALKRASLQWQLEEIELNQVQDILESALEPWLRSNGYLS